MNGASGKIARRYREGDGTVSGPASVLPVAGNFRSAPYTATAVDSTIPGRILPTTEPMPGKFDAPRKFPPPPNGVPMRTHIRRRDVVARQAKVRTRGTDERKLRERLPTYVARCGPAGRNTADP